MQGGRVVVLVSAVPYKCPAAPYEAALLAAALLRDRGLAERTSVEVYTPEPQPMPTAGPAMGEAVAGMLAARGIAPHTNTSVASVNASARELMLADARQISYDVLIGVPPHRAPDVVRHSGLATETGSCRSMPLPFSPPPQACTRSVTSLPFRSAAASFCPKAGVFAHAQAEVVAHRIAAELTGRKPTAIFDGHGGCFLETGDGAAAYTTGDFYAPDGPRLRLRRPGRRWHWVKVAFEQYWLHRWL
jgi:sulfide:quinone oxidoreductase